MKPRGKAVNFIPKVASSTGRSTPPWDGIFRTHAEATQRYQAAAAAAQGDPDLEDEATSALQELMAIEDHALAVPADGMAAFRFKIALWGDGRTEGYEDQWSVFAQDCERLLLDTAKKR